MKVGESIKSLRQAAGLLQRELAERAGISAPMLSLVENGDREPTIALLKEIGRALGIPPGVLVVAALVDDTGVRNTAVGKRTRQMSMSLLKAAEHAVRANRAREQRTKARGKSARRSA